MEGKPKLETGQIYFSQAVAAHKKQDRAFSAWCLACLAAHMDGNWGDVDPNDAAANDAAVKSGGQILSTYRYDDTTRIGILTTPARDKTTIQACIGCKFDAF
jgi:hypothetical protein